MKTEEKDYIEMKTLGNVRVVHVDMSKRMYQNFESTQQDEKRETIDTLSNIAEDACDMNDIMQQIKEKQDAIYMENEALKQHDVKEELVMEEEKIPSFKRRFVEAEEVKKIDQEKQFDWNAKEYWESPEPEETNITQEIMEQPFHQEIYMQDDVAQQIEEARDKEDAINNVLNSAMEIEMHKGEEPHNNDESQLHLSDEERIASKSQTNEENKESKKFIFYTVFMLVVDILLIFLLNNTSEFEGSLRYLCIFIKYAVCVHLLITLYSTYKDIKMKRMMKRGVNSTWQSD